MKKKINKQKALVEKKKDLKKLSAINKINIQRFNKSGIKAIDQLAKLNPTKKIEFGKSGKIENKKKSKEKNFYSPTMLKKYLSCKHIIFNEKYEKELKLKRKPHSNIDQLRFDKGNIHEAKYFEKLKKKYSKVKDIKKLKNVDKFKETLNAMKQGYEIIYGGWLTDGKWSGEADFLEINKKNKSNFGDYFYEVIDTKNSKKIKGDHIYQTGVYYDLLKKSQGIPSENLYILLKDGTKQKIKLNEIYDVFNSHKEKYEQFLKSEVDKTKPEKCSFCTMCDWEEVCSKEWKEKRHINQTGGINRGNQKKRFINSGIDTIDKLAKLNSKTKIEGLRDEIKNKRIEQAKLQIEYEKTGEPISKIIEENLIVRKGFNLIPKPSKSDLFFDLESSTWVHDEKLEYLFGIYYEEDGKQKYQSFWADDKEEEKENLIKFFDFTKAHFKKHKDAKIYHYGNYEIQNLERLTSTYKVKHIEYDQYLRSSKFVNLLSICQDAIMISENSYSLKNIEKFYPFNRTGDVQKGEQSEEFYLEWVQTNNKKFKDQIIDYNKQDCYSTFKLREWLLEKKKETGTKFFEQVEENEDDGELMEHEKKIVKYQDKIKNSKLKNKKILNLLSDIIGFYVRENKPKWREFFDRRNLSDDELLDDRECIAKMKLVSSYKDPTPKKRSMIYKYAFPDQEYKLKKGTVVTIANNVDLERPDAAGTIEDLDQIKKIVILRKGISKNGLTLPNILSIGEKPPKHTRYDKLNENIYTYCDNILENKNDYKALTSLLNKFKPSIDGIKQGEKIIKTENFEEEIPSIVSRLKDSFVILQGPPGTGKTYHAANTIIELIKKKKRIAVTGNSHKVIHNLLDNIEYFADKKKIQFKGLKKVNENDEETYFNGKYEYIENAFKDQRFKDGLFDKSVLLFAGTKYHLANSYYHAEFDYLFVDEASQISLADIVSLGSITKNIVLIGDQQQLGQPTGGSHPGESGKSILDYLLEDKETIDEDTGIFLNITYRLHPKINNFISPSFYEGRLLTHSNNKKRKINFIKGSPIISEGVHYIQMDHEDRTQTSDEEYQVISKIMKQLLASKFVDKDNKVRDLTIEDILIVSPYNAQVNYLKERLDKNSRVGTVDKFQGQESPICLISMTTSDIENLPRNKKFFFNRNRLNVAVSRAKCASIILFNPRLLDTAPADYEEMKMLNNFYKL